MFGCVMPMAALSQCQFIAVRILGGGYCAKSCVMLICQLMNYFI